MIDNEAEKCKFWGGREKRILFEYGKEEDLKEGRINFFCLFFPPFSLSNVQDRIKLLEGAVSEFFC